MASVLDGVCEGWRYLARNRRVCHLQLLFFMGVLCTGTWLPLAPVFIRHHLRGSDQLLGIQLGTIGCGAAIGALAAPRLVAVLGRGMTLMAALLAEGMAMCLYASVGSISGSMIMAFVWGLVVPVVTVPLYSMLQTLVEDAFVGRVFSQLRQLENAALILAMAAAVWLEPRVGSHRILLCAGLVYVSVIGVSSTSRDGRMLLETR